MKRSLVLFIVVALAVTAFAVVWAQGPEGRGGPMEEEQMWGMAGGGMGLMGPAAIAVSGNNVFVVTRGLVLKYDQDLNLIKQAELPIREGEIRGRGGRGGGGGRGARGGGGGGGGRGGRGGGGGGGMRGGY